MKMIKFKDLFSDTILGGILLDDGDIICGCCGGLIDKNDNTFKIIEELEWINISEEILGD